MRIQAWVVCQVVLAGVAFTTAAARGAEISRSFHVGNSLTGQTVGNDVLKNLAAARGIDITYGFHIKCGSGLGSITANPTETCVGPTSFGYFTPALSNNPWDVVTLQTYGDTYDVNKAAIKQMVNLTRSNAANQATKFFIFEGWPQDYQLGQGIDYSDHWTSTYDPSIPDDWNNRLRTWSRGYSDQLMSQLRGAEFQSQFSSPLDIRRVRTGEVLYQLDQLAEAGQLGTTTEIEQWYADPYHLTEFGGYVSQLTMLTAVYGENPVGLAKPAAMSPEVAAIVQQTVWNVVRADPYSTAAVPEPTGFAVLGVGAMALLRRRRAS